MSNLSISILGIMSIWSNKSHLDISSRNTVNNIMQSINLRQEIQTIIYFGDFPDLAPYLTISSGVPKVVITDPIRNLEFSDGCGFNNQMVFLAIGRLQSNPLWHYMYDTFKNVQGYTRGIFIVPEREKVLAEDLKSHFTWCWSNGFSEVMILCERANESMGFLAYTFNPYPDINVSKIEISTNTTYFKYKLKDLHGTKIRTPLQFDPPRVYTELPCTNESKILGYAAKIFKTFLQKKNGDLDPLQDENDGRSNIRSIITQLLRDETSFSIHPYFPLQDIHITYPIYMIRWCLLVPVDSEIDTYEYFLRPFQAETWLLLIFILCIISGIYSLSEITTSGGTKKMDFWRCFITNIRILTFQTAWIPRLSQIRLPYALFVLMIIFFGFLLTNLYLATLTSFFTKSLQHDQINTLKDVVLANLSVLVGNFEASTILTNFDLPSGLADLLVKTQGSTVIHDILSLKPGTAYAAGEDLIQFSLLQLKHLKYPRFRMVDECLTTLPIGFLLPSHSQFETALNFFIMDCEAAGLTKKWTENMYFDGRTSGILKIQEEIRNFTRPLSPKDLQFHWMLLGCGLTISLIVFVLEKFSIFLRRLRIIKIKPNR